jgi:hypothetical protein
LKSAALSVSDMPTGWAAATESDDDTVTGFCNRPVPDEGLSKAQAGFQKSDLGPIAEEALRGYASADAVSEVLKQIRDDASSCTSMIDKGDQVHIAALSFPTVGDATFAVQLSGEGATFDEAFIQVGNVLVQVGEGGLDVDPDLAVRFARRSVELVRAASSSWR